MTSRSNITICVAPANPQLDAHLLFDKSYKETSASPIDEFMLRLRPLNLLSPHPDSFDSLTGQLVLLGVIAAVESYLRALFRKLILIDEGCELSSHSENVTFAAAIHLEREMLPEALLEKISFIKANNVEEALRKLLGVKGNLPAELISASTDYEKVCHLRHCAVHRFGKLGVSNAMHLGILKHKDLLEKPLRLDYVALQNSIAISTGFVKTVNNFLFNEMLSRMPAAKWAGNYSKDKNLFRGYYKLFADSTSSAGATAAPKCLYDDFMKWRLNN